MAGEGPTPSPRDVEEDDGGLTPSDRHPRARERPEDRRDRVRLARLTEGGGGWSWILSDLKTLLETGKALEL